MQRAFVAGKLFFFFCLGAGLTAVILTASAYLIFTAVFRDKIYPGVKTNHLDLSGQTQNQAEKFLLSNLSDLSNLNLTFTSPQATVSAAGRDLNLTYNAGLMTRRAFSVGRQTDNPYYNFLQILAAVKGGLNLPLEVYLDRRLLDLKLAPVAVTIEKKARDAVFKFTAGAGPDGKGRVETFRPSENGLALNREKIAQEIINRAKQGKNSLSEPISLYVQAILPAVKTSTADDLGIKNLLGRGESYFYDSIPGRVYNIGLGTEKISGSLLAPGETFSFNQAIGTVSAVFGFQKAYVIKDGKTILGDGGGVCQVSTTLYRAVLNAGLPVITRTAHSYRVGFYEQGGFLPGLDATVYSPSPDFQFKNDTPGWILIQANFNPAVSQLSFDIFGTSDGRKTAITGPVFLSTSPPPPPIYEDDPELAEGQIRQIDTSHPGAKVYFKRRVIRNGETLIDETVYSDFIPWPARYLRGTKT